MEEYWRRGEYRVHFLTDDVFCLGGNQRAKLQYHILAQQFLLVAVSCTDCEELEAFAAASDSETAQRWLNRMKWVDGHGKMVSFGAALKVPGNTYGLWCYRTEMDKTSATYTGVPMSWELWETSIKIELDMARRWRTATEIAIKRAMLCLYYCKPVLSDRSQDFPYGCGEMDISISERRRNTLSLYWGHGERGIHLYH